MHYQILIAVEKCNVFGEYGVIVSPTVQLFLKDSKIAAAGALQNTSFCSFI